MQRRALIASVLIAGLLIAGCFGGGDGADSAAQSPSASPGGSTGTPTTSLSPGQAPGEPSLTSESWSGQECHQLATPFYGTGTFVDDNLPASYSSAAGASAALFLLILDCPAVTVGNATLVEPFQLAAVYAFVQKLDENSSRQEAYVFESMLNNESLVEAANDYGWPTQLGSITFSNGPTQEIHIQAESMDYVITVAPLASGSGGLNRHESIWYVTDEPKETLLVDLVQTTDDGLADVGLVQANQGTLSQAFAAGAFAGTPEQVTINLGITFARSDTTVA